MILCARCTSRSNEQSTKNKLPSENMWKVCLFFSQNNKIVWLSNMAEHFWRNSRSAQRFVCFFLDCALPTPFLLQSPSGGVEVEWLVWYDIVAQAPLNETILAQTFPPNYPQMIQSAGLLWRKRMQPEIAEAERVWNQKRWTGRASVRVTEKKVNSKLDLE